MAPVPAAERNNVVMAMAESTEDQRADTPLEKVCKADEHVDDLVMRDRSAWRDLEDQLAQAQKHETVGILASNLAHDFNNLLTIIGCNVATVLESIPPDDAAHRILWDAQRASHQAAELIRDLLTFNRRTEPRAIACNLSEAVSEAVRLMRHTMPPGVELRTDFSREPLPLRGDPAKLHQVVVNLCLNARDTMGEGGTVTLRTSRRRIEDARGLASPAARAGEFVVLSIEDTGRGTERQVPGQVFEPLFTTKPVSEGTGLGLAVVRNIVDAHHGWVEVESAPGRGTRVDVYLPGAAAPVEEVAQAVDPDSLCGVGTVLLADDEAMIVALLRTVLESRGYQALTAHTASEAVSLFEQQHQSVEGVVLDWNLPKVNGLRVLERLRQVAPGVPVVVVSGTAPSAGEAPIPVDEHTRFVAKPFTPTEVLEALKSVTGGACRSTPSKS